MLPVASDACASSESVTTTPRKPSSSRRSSCTIGRDCDAMRDAVERGVPRVADHYERDAGGDRRPERRQVDRVERGARPPDRHDRVVGVRGRCAQSREVLRGRRDPAGSPSPHGVAHGAAGNARVAENDRPASAAPRTLGTSATGANVTVMPAARRARAAASASARTVPRATCSGCAANGPAHVSRRTVPPSWSTATSGRPPARRRSRVSARSSSWPVMLPPNRITPATRFAASASRTYCGTVVPLKLRTSTWPTCCSSVSRSTAAGVPRATSPIAEHGEGESGGGCTKDHRHVSIARECVRSSSSCWSSRWAAPATRTRRLCPTPWPMPTGRSCGTCRTDGWDWPGVDAVARRWAGAMDAELTTGAD